MCRLEDLAALEGLAGEVLSLLQDLLDSETPMEAFDTMELLPQVLSTEGSCEEFLGWKAAAA